MTVNAQQILKDALELPSKARANLADHLLSSLDQPDGQIDNLWRRERDRQPSLTSIAK